MSDNVSIKLKIIHPDTNVSGIVCPYCLKNFNVGDSVVLCPKCNEVQHVRCFITWGNKCGKEYGCDFQAEVDWVAPLYVDRIEAQVDATSTDDTLGAKVATSLGGTVGLLADIPIINALLAEIGPTYLLALHHYLLLSIMILVGVDLGKSIFFRWQVALISKPWPYILFWLAILLAYSLIITLRASKRWKSIGWLLSVTAYIGTGIILIPILVKLFFIPKFLWPNGIGMLFSAITWGQIPLAIIFGIFFLYIAIVGTGAIASIPRSILTLLRLTFIDFVKPFVGIITFGTLTWAAIALGSDIIARSAQNTATEIVKLGLSISSNIYFVGFAASIFIANVLGLRRQIREAAKEKTEIANA